MASPDNLAGDLVETNINLFMFPNVWPRSMTRPASGPLRPHTAAHPRYYLISSLWVRPPGSLDIMQPSHGSPASHWSWSLLLGISLCVRVTVAILPVWTERWIMRSIAATSSSQVNRHFSASRGERAPDLECLVGLDSVTLTELYMVRHYMSSSELRRHVLTSPM